MDYPTLEFKGMMKAWGLLKKKEHDAISPPQSPATLDCDVVNDDDLKSWFPK